MKGTLSAQFQFGCIQNGNSTKTEIAFEEELMIMLFQLSCPT